MKKIVVLGTSLAGMKAVETLRQEDSSCEITVVAFDGHYPYNRDLFPELIARTVETKNLFYRSQKFYEQTSHFRIKWSLTCRKCAIQIKNIKFFHL